MESTFWGLFTLFFGAIAFGQIARIIWHVRERNRKFEMMRAYPHLSREIYQSIEEQDARMRQESQKFCDGINNAFTPKPKPKAGGGMLKLGLGIARRLVK